MTRKLFTILMCLIAPPSVYAQSETALNPQRAQFTASPDHAAMVVRYELRHFVVGQTIPIRIDNLGKPTPDGTNTITATFPVLPKDYTKQYTATVTAIGSSGEGNSTPSNVYLFAEGVQMLIPQKVDLTIIGYDDVGNLLPPATDSVLWAVEGSSITNILGTFETAYNSDGSIKPLSMWFFPIKSGVFRIQASFVIANIPFNAWTIIVVNQ
jgi:hypothetical protein